MYECCSLCYTEYVDIYLAAGDCSCMTPEPGEEAQLIQAADYVAYRCSYGPPTYVENDYDDDSDDYGDYGSSYEDHHEDENYDENGNNDENGDDYQ